MRSSRFCSLLLYAIEKNPMEQKRFSDFLRQLTLVAILVTTIIVESKAQAEGPPVKSHNLIGMKPNFTGGEDSLQHYLKKNLVYPPSALEKRIEGSVIVQFVVEEEGQLTNLYVVKGLSPECDQEALRLVKGMRKWEPGIQRGNPVRVQFDLPIKFELPK